MDSFSQTRLDAILSGYKVKTVVEDLSPALHIWYDGPYHYAKITVGGTAAITGYADDTNGATTVAPWGTAGVITHSAGATDTLGEIADAINAYQSAGWHCRIEAGLRATAVATDGDIIDMAATSCLASAGGVHLYYDTSAQDEHYVEVSGWDCYNDNRGNVCLLAAIQATITAGTATGTAARIYACKGIAHADKETLIYQHGTILTTATLQVIDHDDWGNKPLRGDPGDHLVIGWGTKGTTAMTGTAGLATGVAIYNVIGSSRRASYRSAR